ncbi:MAG TPA: CPBP family glutamic-type intramembrane protease [Candidatus Dormibacteraeota bacterium]
MIQIGLAAPRRAAGLTGLVLGAALIRALLLPLGDLLSTLVFGGCLLAIALVERTAPTLPSPAGGGGKVGRAGSLLAGLMVGAVLLVPLTAGSLSARGLDGFWAWAALAAVIATLEEIAIRGALFRRWSDEAGPVAAIVAGAVVFALIHLPRYGLGAMPLDAAVGLALGGLRALTGRVAPCAVAHVIADWGAWFWA